ncbi:MAG: DNA mismatch repair endonuclease MutL [Proteobacteria bacterium]|nr:DNA mismatch repair endonuclease MutL [Pseudomonadota bacterium]MBU4472310.1 DNA mismatch repair endonuclease MutL [Pseudomonadota bacterium]MCG2752006.1 DNA mismatch repair endonuclease MutL [Desulfobacteraceae bacterium]
MGAVKILPEILSNKIAAGEVVERPASVVKELVENALDAKSTSITVDVEKGGRSLIRISDNGLGMTKDDALLSLERYATSKIYTDQDLFSIQTLGFRGEALPSIASVSRFSMISRDEESVSGTRISVEGGKITEVSDAGAPVGTMITVKDLFFNTPARRKFLKTIPTEMGHIADMISRIALAHPGVRIKLTHNGQTVYQWSESKDPRHRVLDVLGKDVQGDLRPVDFSQNNIRVTGWVASDRNCRSTGREIYLYVNQRFVRDRIISHALFEGFSGRLMKGKFPVAVLFLALAPDEVDVNVHPTKNEVRFSESQTIHGVVSSAVSLALREPQKTISSRVFPAEPPIVEPLRAFQENPAKTFRFEPLVFEEKPSASAEPSFNRRGFPHTEIREQTRLWERRFFSDLRIVGQIHNTYIIAEDSEGCILIDQHAAHERVIYEQIQLRGENQLVPSQGLLMPEIFEPGFRESEILLNLIPELSKAGWDMEPFGGESFAIKAVPSVLADCDVIPVIREILEKIIDLGFTTDLKSALDESKKIMACHGAIRASQSLSERQVQKLMEQLDTCENASNCPHGRPTWIRLSRQELEKRFRRTL